MREESEKTSASIEMLPWMHYAGGWGRGLTQLRGWSCM